MSNHSLYNQCPYCKSENISGYECDFDGSVATTKLNVMTAKNNGKNVMK